MASLLEVEPLQLHFSSTPGATAEIRLTCPSNPQPKPTIAFKLQTNASYAFTVKPVYGYLAPGETAVVTVRVTPSDPSQLHPQKPKKIMVRALDVSNLVPNLPPVKQLWLNPPQGGVQKTLISCSFPPVRTADLRKSSDIVGNEPHLTPIDPDQKRLALKSTTELLIQGTEEVQTEAVQHAIETFSFVLGRLKATPMDPMRAPALIGLGEAYNKSGLQNRALDCFKSAIPVFQAAADHPGTVRVMGLIAALYAEMQLSAHSAAWYAEQLKALDAIRSPSNASRRGAIALARDIQLRGAAQEDVVAAMNEIEAEMSRSRSMSMSTAPKSPPSVASASATKKVPALWEDQAGSSGFITENSGGLSANGDVANERDDPSRSNGAKPRGVKRVTKVDANSRLLIPTVASENWRAGKVDRLGAEVVSPHAVPVPKRASSLSSSTPTSDQDHESKRSVVNRNARASSTHVDRVSKGRGEEAPGRRASGETSTICVLRLNCGFSRQRLKLVLPGPRKAKNLSVREIREKASFVCGIPVDDFELAVAQMPLSDAWFCSDCGIHNDCTIDLTLRKGVDPSQYQTLQRPPQTSTHSSHGIKERTTTSQRYHAAATPLPNALREPYKRPTANGQKSSSKQAFANLNPNKDDMQRRLELAQVYLEATAVEQEAARIKADEISDRIQSLLQFAGASSTLTSPKNGPTVYDVEGILALEREIQAEAVSGDEAMEVITCLSSSFVGSNGRGHGKAYGDVSLCIVVVTPESEDLVMEKDCVVSKFTRARWKFSLAAGPIEFEEFLLGFPDQFLPLSALDVAEFWFSFGPISPLRQCSYDAITRYAKHVFANAGVAVQLQAIEISKRTDTIRDLLHVPSREKPKPLVTIKASSKGLVFQGSTSVRLSGFREFLLLRKRIKGKVIAAQGHVVFALLIQGQRDNRTFVYVDVEPSLTGKFVKNWRDGAAQTPLNDVILAAKQSKKYVLCPVVTTELTEPVEETLSLFKCPTVDGE